MREKKRNTFWVRERDNNEFSEINKLKGWANGENNREKGRQSKREETAGPAQGLCVPVLPSVTGPQRSHSYRPTGPCFNPHTPHQPSRPSSSASCPRAGQGGGVKTQWKKMAGYRESTWKYWLSVSPASCSSILLVWHWCPQSHWTNKSLKSSN